MALGSHSSRKGSERAGLVQEVLPSSNQTHDIAIARIIQINVSISSRQTRKGEHILGGLDDGLSIQWLRYGGSLR